MATVVTSDGVFLNVRLGFIEKCSVLNDIHQTCNCDLFPIPNVNCKALTKMVEFYETGQMTGADDCMLQILLAADYLGYEELLDYGAKLVADSLKGKSATEIRRYFGLEVTPVS